MGHKYSKKIVINHGYRVRFSAFGNAHMLRNKMEINAQRTSERASERG